VHSRTDSTIPVDLGRQVHDAKAGSKFGVTVNGFSHNAIYDSTPPEIWSPIVTFILGANLRDAGSANMWGE
jgi:hypothetical protein